MIKLKLYLDQIMSFLQIVQGLHDHVSYTRLHTVDPEDRADLYVDQWELQQLSTILGMKYFKLKQKQMLDPRNTPVTVQLSPTHARILFLKYKGLKPLQHGTPWDLVTLHKISEPVFKQLTS